MPTQREALRQKRELEHETLLIALDQALEMPMVVLSFVMLVLFIVEFTTSLSLETKRTVNLIQWFIWLAFVVEFFVKIAIAPDKLKFLRGNWLMALAVALPALRVLRIARAARAVRSLGALRVVTVGNRSIRQLGHLLDRRHLQYLVAVVIVVTILGASGMFFLERGVPQSNIRSFGDSLWWAAGAVTNAGTELYPVSGEGRVLAVMIMVFGVSLFGYVAGSLASMFVQTDKSADEEERAAVSQEKEECSPALLEEIRQLQQQISELAAISRQEGKRRELS